MCAQNKQRDARNFFLNVKFSFKKNNNNKNNVLK